MDAGKTLDAEGGLIFIDDPYQNHSCQNWIDIEPKSVLIEPNSKREVSVSIKVPTAVQGGNYAAILFDVDNRDKEGGQVALTIRTGTMILLSVQNTIKYDAVITTFNVIQDYGKTVFEVWLENKSNKHIKPTGSVVIFENGKRVIDRVNFDENTFILPGSERVLTCTWSNPVKRKQNMTYRAECRLTVLGLGKSLHEETYFSTLEF